MREGLPGCWGGGGVQLNTSSWFVMCTMAVEWVFWWTCRRQVGCPGDPVTHCCSWSGIFSMSLSERGATLQNVWERTNLSGDLFDPASTEAQPNVPQGKEVSGWQAAHLHHQKQKGRWESHLHQITPLAAGITTTTGLLCAAIRSTSPPIPSSPYPLFSSGWSWENGIWQAQFPSSWGFCNTACSLSCCNVLWCPPLETPTAGPHAENTWASTRTLVGPIHVGDERNREHQILPFPEGELRRGQLKLFLCVKGEMCASVSWRASAMGTEHLPSQYPSADFSRRRFSSPCPGHDTSLSLSCLCSLGTWCTDVGDLAMAWLGWVTFVFCLRNAHVPRRFLRPYDD